VRCALHCSWSCSTVRSSRTSQPRRKRIDRYLPPSPPSTEAGCGRSTARLMGSPDLALVQGEPHSMGADREFVVSQQQQQQLQRLVRMLGSTVCHICAGTGLAPATSAPGPVSQVRNASVSGELSVLLPCCCLLRLQNPFVKVCSAPCVCAEYTSVSTCPARSTRPPVSHSLIGAKLARRTSALRAARALHEAGRAALLL
jgi:hypothetical protein